MTLFHEPLPARTPSAISVAATLWGEGHAPLWQYFPCLLSEGRRGHPGPQRARIIDPKPFPLQIASFLGTASGGHHRHLGPRASRRLLGGEGHPPLWQYRNRESQVVIPLAGSPTTTRSGWITWPTTSPWRARCWTAPSRARTRSGQSYVTYIESSAERVWDALTDADLTAKYWGHSNVSDWHVGSTWKHERVDGSGIADVIGTVLTSEPPHRLRMTFDAPGDTLPEGSTPVTFETTRTTRSCASQSRTRE
jgi:hypothetical protein